MAHRRHRQAHHHADTAVGPDSARLATTSRDHVTRIWELSGHRCRAQERL
jgi:hypothetical protein